MVKSDTQSKVTKKIIKVLSLVLTIIIVLGTLPTFEVEAQASSGVVQKLNSLRSKFPEGYFWNHKVTHVSNNGDNLKNNWDESYANCVTTSPCQTHKAAASVGGYDCNFFDGGVQCFGFAGKIFYDVFGQRKSNLAKRVDKNNVSVGDYVRINNDSHSAVVLSVNGSNITVVECNLDLAGPAYNCKIRWGASYPISSINYFMHATNYDQINNTNWKQNTSKTNVGDDFYGAIINTERNKALTVESDKNVAIYTFNGSLNQIWHFEKLSDCSYKITSCYNGEVLDLYGGATSGWANVITYPYANTPNQKWSFYGTSPNLFVSADCNLGVLDVADAKYDDGTNICVNTKTGHNAQLFKITKVDTPSTPTLSVNSSTETVTFSWIKTASTKNYDLKIYKGSTLYKSIVSIQGTSYSLKLPAGTYSATITAKNDYSSKTSNKVSFTVKSASSGDWIYANSLPSGITAQNYIIEYRHTYEKISKTSPGSGWTQGALVKQQYENSGDVYYSDLPLSTSNTRVLVDYWYYHFCNGSKGSEVNYAQTSVYNHYDSIAKDNVYEFYSHADYSDSRYTFYGLKYKNSDNYVYCSSGTTCDGSYGSHGTRSYYWYKTYAYQNKVAVNYYKYTRQGDWTSTKDNSASSYTVRYKPLNNTTAIQKPGVTSKITATSATNSIKLQWNKVNGATGYRVFQKINGKWTKLTTTNANTFTVKSLKAGTKYSFAVKAYTKYNGNVLWATKYASIGTATTPAKIKTLKASQTTNSIKLTWNKVNGVSGYRVYVKSNGEWKKLKDVTTTSYTVKNLKVGKKYTFAVKPYIETSAGKVCPTYTQIQTATQTAQVKNLKAAKTSTRKNLNLTWNSVSGADGYSIYHLTGNKWTKLGDVTTSSCEVTNLQKGKTYTFAVKPYISTKSGRVSPQYTKITVKNN